MTSNIPLSARSKTIPDNLNGIDAESISLAIKLCYGLLLYQDSAYGFGGDVERIKRPLRELFPFLEALLRSVESNQITTPNAKTVQRSIDSCTSWIDKLQEKMYKYHIPARETDRYRDAPKRIEPLKGEVLDKISIMIQNIRDNLGPALECLQL